MQSCHNNTRTTSQQRMFLPTKGLTPQGEYPTLSCLGHGGGGLTHIVRYTLLVRDVPPLVLEVHILAFRELIKGLLFSIEPLLIKGLLLAQNPLRENPVRIEGEYYL